MNRARSSGVAATAIAAGLGIVAVPGCATVQRVTPGAPTRSDGIASAVTRVTYDAAQGTTTPQQARVDTRDRVEVAVINVNPFLHRYRIVGTRTTYAETAIANFAKALGIPVDVPKAPELTTRIAEDAGQVNPLFRRRLAPEGTSGHAALCDTSVDAATRGAADKQAAGLERQATSVGAYGRALTGALRTLRDTVARRDTVVSVRVAALQAPVIAADSLRSLVGLLVDSTRTYAGALAARQPRLADSVAGYNQRVADVRAQAAARADKYPACLRFAEILADASNWSGDTALLRGTVTRLATQATALATLAETLERLRRLPEATSLRHTFGGFDDPSVVEVLVQRSPAGADTAWRTLAEPRLSFGGGRRRFAIGIGAVGTAIGTADYSIVRRYHAGATPADTTESVVVETARARRQIAPLVNLTARLATVSWWRLDGVHLAVGTAPRSDQSKLTLDYLLGGGVSAYDERIFLSAGVASGQERRLAAGLTNGARVPAAQPSVPTRTTRVTQPSVALTFRVY